MATYGLTKENICSSDWNEESLGLSELGCFLDQRWWCCLFWVTKQPNSREHQGALVDFQCSLYYCAPQFSTFTPKVIEATNIVNFALRWVCDMVCDFQCWCKVHLQGGVKKNGGWRHAVEAHHTLQHNVKGGVGVGLLHSPRCYLFLCPGAKKKERKCLQCTIFQNYYMSVIFPLFFLKR